MGDMFSHHQRPESSGRRGLAEKKQGDKIIKIENEKGIKREKRVSQINLINTHKKKKQYCKTDSLFLHRGLQNPGWSFLFGNARPSWTTK